MLHSGVYETGRFANVDPSRVVTRQDAALLVEAMVDDLRRHPDEWGNQTLERFLEVLVASLASGRDWPEHLSWRLPAEALTVASGYEQQVGTSRAIGGVSGSFVDEVRGHR